MQTFFYNFLTAFMNTYKVFNYSIKILNNNFYTIVEQLCKVESL